MEDRRGSYTVLVGNPEGKRPLGRPRVILKWFFKKWNWRGMEWIDLIQDKDTWRAIVYTVMNLRVPKMRGIS
jgi:hypothetical protein